ncbi:MAG: hypothetical protein GY898_04340, partial [Proteobacteria bacterium]|nr:hypothetical protein [Pseudomonadota bacterium]
MKRASFLFLSAAVLAGCPTTNEDPDEGIYVGNPGVTALRIGAIDGTDVVDQGFSAEEFTLTSCDGEHTDSV